MVTCLKCHLLLEIPAFSKNLRTEVIDGNLLPSERRKASRADFCRGGYLTLGLALVIVAGVGEISGRLPSAR